MRLQVCCPEHGLFSDIVFSRHVAAAPAPPGLIHGCQVPAEPWRALAGLPFCLLSDVAVGAIVRGR